MVQKAIELVQSGLEALHQMEPVSVDSLLLPDTDARVAQHYRVSSQKVRECMCVDIGQVSLRDIVWFPHVCLGRSEERCEQSVFWMPSVILPV